MKYQNVRNIRYAKLNDSGITDQDASQAASEFVTLDFPMKRCAFYNLFVIELHEYFDDLDHPYAMCLGDKWLGRDDNDKKWILKNDNQEYLDDVSDEVVENLITQYLQKECTPPEEMCREFARGLIASRKYNRSKK